MNLKYISATLVIVILTACVPKPPATVTTAPILDATSAPLPTLAPTETSLSTEPPLPTNTTEPFLTITKPADKGTVGCVNSKSDNFCLFELEGKTGGFSLSSNLRIWVFVKPTNPPGVGWYLQKSSATTKSNGDWKQSPSYLGNDKIPAVTGQTLTIRAVLVTGDATLNDIKLDDLAKSNDLIVLNAIEEIKGIVTLSDPVDLTLDRP